VTLCCIQDTVYNFHIYFYFYEHCGSCLKKKQDINSCEFDRHNCMLALVPLRVTEAVIVFLKPRKILLNLRVV
jgi:hypothetical protein